MLQLASLRPHALTCLQCSLQGTTAGNWALRSVFLCSCHERTLPSATLGLCSGRGSCCCFISAFWPLSLQLFSEVQEKAIEEQMVAVKDVVMEPTMKTLSDDLVCRRPRPCARGGGAPSPLARVRGADRARWC